MGNILTQPEAQNEAEIMDLKRQIKALNDRNRELEQKLHEINTHPNTDEQTLETEKLLSKQRISQYVEGLLNDETVNIKYLPDWVERQIYRNFFGILVGVVNNMADSTSIELLGHQLKFDLVPNNSDEAK